MEAAMLSAAGAHALERFYSIEKYLLVSNSGLSRNWHPFFDVAPSLIIVIVCIRSSQCIDFILYRQSHDPQTCLEILVAGDKPEAANVSLAWRQDIVRSRTKALQRICAFVFCSWWSATEYTRPSPFHFFIAKNCPRLVTIVQSNLFIILFVYEFYAVVVA